jgi:hypothetical protein
MADEEMVMDFLGVAYANTMQATMQHMAFLRAIGEHHRLPPEAYRNSQQNYPQDAFRPLPASYFTGLAMHGGDRIAYQESLRRARPIIAQWSEWERQTRMDGWR